MLRGGCVPQTDSQSAAGSVDDCGQSSSGQSSSSWLTQLPFQLDSRHSVGRPLTGHTRLAQSDRLYCTYNTEYMSRGDGFDQISHRGMEPVAVLRSQLSVRRQFQDGSEDISVHCCQYVNFNCTFHLILILLHALYDWLCTAPLNRLPCYGDLEMIRTLLLLLLLLSWIQKSRLHLHQPAFS